MKVTILAENSAVGQGIQGEHGLSFHISAGERKILFDAGQGLVIMRNAAARNIDLADLDAIVLSHGHYDHTGGLAQVLKVAPPEVPIYAHPDALAPKYRVTPSVLRSIGIPDDSLQAVEQRQEHLVLSTESIELFPGMRTLGEIPRKYEIERSHENFYLDTGGQLPDLILDDQGLLIETESGMVVLLGCTHAGLINTLEHIQELTNGVRLRAVVGGLHLRSASAERLTWTLHELQRFEIDLFAPMHCTGFWPTAAVAQAFPKQFQWAGAGETLIF